MIARRIASAFKSRGEYFEYLMNEYSTPEEIFGPVSLTELQKDNYQRKTQGFLPQAKIAFLDEIWKSGHVILNTLLTIINEKKFHNGNKIETVPLMALLACSNELPQKNAGLDALYDRFIVRYFVEPVKDKENFFSLISLESKTGDLKFSQEEKSSLLDTEDIKKWQPLIDEIEVPQSVKNIIWSIKQELNLKNQKWQEASNIDTDTDTQKEAKDEGKSEQEGFYVSDRRWKKIVHILKTSAFLNGRKEIDLMDCALIEHCIWSTKKQKDLVQGSGGKKGIIQKVLEQNCLDADYQIDDIKDALEDYEEHINNRYFEKKQEKEKEITVTINGEECYQCKDDRGNLCYIGVDRNDGYDAYNNYHNYYNANQEYMNCNQMTKKGHTITYGRIEYKIDVASPVTKTVPKKYGAEERATLIDDSNNKYYLPIAQQIQEQIEKLSKQREPKQKQFASNLFSNQKYTNVLLNSIDNGIEELEQNKVELEKLRAKYMQ